ncbi:hypothetical protein SSP24_62370 [Streptomyces spinoverrucosus]|uniref:Uncharacterized protein n=1 Tax=Streptomyces spinoverrucosus TaxID=284043 RepID=A0A4Y3VNJ6_9ACTN|nr:hypothetical protein SSP24_62370 [Streptomyces spinoverrucosus]GHB69045.1 hypothetical protein GCM10010397_44250 [Streptomyces spinoverrucosus]
MSRKASRTWSSRSFWLWVSVSRKPHDPRSNLARAGDVGPDRLGGARAEGGEVCADDLAAASVAAGPDLQRFGRACLAAGVARAVSASGVACGAAEDLFAEDVGVAAVLGQFA